MKILQDHLDELEFPKLLGEIAPYAYSPKVAEKILSLHPMDREQAEFLLKKTSEYLSSYESENIIPFDEYEDIEEPIKLMQIENFRLEASAFFKIRKITEQIGKLQSFFPKLIEVFPNLNEEVRDLEFKKEIIDKISAVFNRFGEVKNDATPLLKEIREDIALTKKNIQENFNKSLNHYAQQDFLDEIRESIIEDQRVLAVKSGVKKRVSGKVLGISKTGSITYIQPESVVKHYYQLREREEEQKKEIDSILRKLTADIAQYREQLESYQEYIYNLDITMAKAKFAKQINGVLPKINTHKTLKLINAYHPLLWLRNMQENKKIFPQTFELSEQNRIICISGPNAGGKSITLKTLGLL